MPFRRFLGLTVAAASLLATQAQARAFSPSPQLQKYRQIAPQARHDVAVWDAWKLHTLAQGKTVTLRGMVDGNMSFGGQHAVFVKVGTHRLALDMGKLDFEIAPGTAIYCVATVTNTQQVPPALRLEACVRNDEMQAWQAAQAETQRHFVPIAWDIGNPVRQLHTTMHWMQSFNASLSDQDAQLWASTLLADAQAHGLDPRLVMSLMAAESAYQADARSSVGAEGLGQLMPDTAAGLGVDNAYDPVQNIHGAVHYLSNLMTLWASSRHPLTLVLASYNAGEGAVQRYGGVPPYPETQNYVAYVLSLYRELGGTGT